MKKLYSILISIILVFSLFGCNNTSNTEILEKADSILANLDSYSIKMDFDIEMKSTMFSITMKIGMNCDAFTKPDKIKMDMTMDIPMLSMNERAEFYSEEAEDGIYMYSCVQGKWIKEGPISFENYREMTTSPSQLSLSSMFDKAIRTEVNFADKKAYCLSTALDMEEINKVMSSMGSPQDSGMTDLLEVLKYEKIPIRAYIDKDNYHLLAMEMDMGNLMKKVMAEEGAEIKECTMLAKIEYYNFNSVPNFEIPEEAKNADNNPYDIPQDDIF